MEITHSIPDGVIVTWVPSGSILDGVVTNLLRPEGRTLTKGEEAAKARINAAAEEFLAAIRGAAGDDPHGEAFISSAPLQSACSHVTMAALHAHRHFQD